MNNPSHSLLTHPDPKKTLIEELRRLTGFTAKKQLGLTFREMVKLLFLRTCSFKTKSHSSSSDGVFSTKSQSEGTQIEPRQKTHL